MNRIFKLDAATAAKIAAGEVVEKPAMVVKELVENAIDAGSKSIVVDIKKGGKHSIRVSDNGSGINFDDIDLVFERHATSKIRFIDDLYQTTTLGFRGEALASICSVSMVELITMQEHNQNGLKILAQGGKITSRQEVGSVVGTSILVKNLFFNTPARLKFLKSDATEAKYITDLMGHLALSHPEIGFKYSVDDRIIFHTPGKGKLSDSIVSIYEPSLIKHLYEINDSLGEMSLKGYISSFDYTRGNKKDQLTFVNGRYVKCDWLRETIQTVYKPYLMNNRFPICFLFLEIPPQNIDVNIHPAKTEIKFHDEGTVKQLIYTALKKAFNLNKQIPEVTFSEKEVFKKPDFIQNFERQDPLKSDSVDNTVVRESAELISAPKVDFEAFKVLLEESRNDDFVPIPPKAFKTEEKHESIYDDLCYIGSFDQTYLLLEKNSQLFMIDQHAAHEKILFEQFMEAFKKESLIGQMLLVPESVELSKMAFQVIESRVDLIKKMGFEFDIFGEQTIVLRSIPSLFTISASKALFLGALEGNDLAMNEALEMQIALKACKAAIKAKDSLDHIEVERLLEDLKKLSSPYTCPHGRPIIIQFSKYDIEKRFKRIV